MPGPDGLRPMTPLLTPPTPQSGQSPSLTTPSSAGALSPTTSITGQLQTQRKRAVWPGQGDRGSLGVRVTHRSVLALGTVPGRLMSRSLRLQGEAEVEVGISGWDPRALLPQGPTPASHNGNYGPTSWSGPRVGAYGY